MSLIRTPINFAKRVLSAFRRDAAPLPVSPLLEEAAGKEANDVLAQLASSTGGLTEEEALHRREKYGPNEIASDKKKSPLFHFWNACRNPLAVLLLILAAVAFLTRDVRSGVVMLVMVAIGVGLKFIQEARADDAAAKLKAMIRVTATVLRSGETKEIPLVELVPGDVVTLSAGDMIPADVRILSAKDLFIVLSTMTGEAFPAERFSARETGSPKSPFEYSNLAFMGTSVESGSALAVVLLTGVETYLGGMAKNILVQPTETSFDKGINSITWLMLRFMGVIVPLVFLINGFGKHNWHEAFFFALAVAVGLTPEMLPMIVTVCLSKGAIVMSKKKVIVKHLQSIQNFGAMDVLCTDKTGTLTMDRVIVQKHCNVALERDLGVLQLGYLNSHFQTSLKNVMDRGIIEHGVKHNEEVFTAAFKKIDEIPFDFSRKVMSVVVETPEGVSRLITKGAPEEVFNRCASFELDGEIYPMDRMLLEDLREEFENLSNDGFRVLGIAYRDIQGKTVFSKDDESELILRGYIAFLDPPKSSAPSAILALNQHGVAVKVLTGDNELVTRKICQDVGIPSEHMIVGGKIESMSDEELSAIAERTTIFARLSPAHKQRVIKILQGKGHVVGYMGDGFNDAAALRAADVGISVDTAVDIAKESADVILLEKSLMVLEEGILEGRKVFANIIKYIRMGASSNFGNMFSVLGASLFLPFLPMAPIQILTNNLLYDFSQVPIPTDEVDADLTLKPMPWSMDRIHRFILLMGPVSSLFDYTTFFIMLFVFGCRDAQHASLFQTGWFVESLLTQTLVIHVIRTNGIPFVTSRASWPLMLTSVAVMAGGIWLTFSPLKETLGFTSLPPLYWPILAVTLLSYVALAQLIKTFLLKKKWI